MAELCVQRALFLIIILSLYEVSPTKNEICNECLSQVLSRLAQPASLELWTDKLCGIHYDARAITTSLKEHNMTFIYQRDITTPRMSQYITKVWLRNLPGNVHRYILMDLCPVQVLTGELEILQHLFQSVNFILCFSSVFHATSARQVLCSTMQLITAPEKNVTLLGLPEKSATMSGCSHWQFHDCSSVTKLFPFRVLWLRHEATPHPTLRNAVIGGTCLAKCNISNSIALLSQVYNFTIADCSDGARSCDFVECWDRRTARELISTGLFLPLIIFSSQSLAFVAPKGALRPKWEYLARPFEVSVWVGLLCSFATLLCFLFLSSNCLSLTFGAALNQLWRLVEFLLCSIFTPLSIPRRTLISSILLALWTLLMQIPATGFRGVMTSFLSEPPRARPISGILELAARLLAENDTTLICFQDTVKSLVLYDILDKDYFLIVEDPELRLPSISENLDFLQYFARVISRKIRDSDCKEYVRNGRGVFFGVENHIRATVEDDTEFRWNQFTRLHYRPNIAEMLFNNPFRKPLSNALLRVFESQVESHLHTLQYIGHEKIVTKHYQLYPSPHTTEDLWTSIQLWLCGTVMASIVLLLECVVSCSQRIFL